MLCSLFLPLILSFKKEDSWPSKTMNVRGRNERESFGKKSEISENRREWKRIMDALEEWERKKEMESEFFLLTQISHLFSSNSQITTKVINPSFYFLFTFNFRSVFLSHHFFSHFLSKLLFPFISKRGREYFHPFVPIQHTMTKLRFNVNYGSILHNVDDDDYFGREHFWGRKLTSYNYTKKRIIKNEPLFVLVCFHEAKFFSVWIILVFRSLGFAFLSLSLSLSPSSCPCKPREKKQIENVSYEPWITN